MSSKPEITALRALVHPNIVKCIESILENGKIHLVFELMPDGDLESHVRKANGPLPPDHIASIAHQLLAAVDYIHTSHFLHRDIKPENVFLSFPLEPTAVPATTRRPPLVKLGDFGLAKSVSAPARASAAARPHTAYVATRWYRAPEQLLRVGGYGSSADMWSVGATLAEVATGGMPLFAGADEAETLGAIYALRGHPEEVRWAEGARAAAGYSKHVRRRTVSKAVTAALKAASPEFNDLINQLLQLDPERRPSAAAALQYPLFAGFAGARSDMRRDYRMCTPAPSSHAGTQDGLFGTGTSRAFDTPSSSVYRSHALHPKRTDTAIGTTCAAQPLPCLPRRTEERRQEGDRRRMTALSLQNLRNDRISALQPEQQRTMATPVATMFTIPGGPPVEQRPRLRSPAGFFDLSVPPSKRR